MPLLIDGHNLIGRMPDLSLDELDDEHHLARRVNRYCQRHNQRAIIVFDAGLVAGRSDSLSTARVDVVFASAGRSADGIMRERLQGTRDPGSFLVISSDREVQQAAREKGARVLSADDFAEKLADRATVEEVKQDTKTPVGSVEEWLDLFNEEGGATCR